jgi:methylmalonyl-CoA/ethylmalonyl-CoA epimerase
VFLHKPGSLDIKLIEPTGEESPLWQFLKRGEGLHHLCFRVENVGAGLAQLEERGLRVLAPPAPGEAFDDELIAFGYAGFGLNVELIDTDRRRDAIASDRPDEPAPQGPGTAGPASAT